MSSKRFFACFAGFSVALFLSSFVTASVATDLPPPVSGIKITEYGDTLTQSAGTTESYEVKVKNIGVLGMDDVRLRAEKIPDGWFSSNEVVDLDFGEVGSLKYILTIPESASGVYAFSLIAHGSYGMVSATDLEPVVIKVMGQSTKPQTTETTTESTPTMTESTTTQPPIISVSETLQKLTGSLSKILDPENIFSKFRDGVNYVRITGKAVLSDEMLLYKTAAVLFITMIILAFVRKAVIGRPKSEELE